MNTEPHPESGSALVIILAVVFIIAGISLPTLMNSIETHEAAGANMLESKLLFVAESGLNYNYVHMDTDPLYAVKDTAGFTWDASEQVYRSGLLTLGSTGGTSQQFRLELQYLAGEVPVEFADRAFPEDDTYDRIRVVCSVTSMRAERKVVAWYGEKADERFSGAVISDMSPEPEDDVSGKGGAKKGHVVIDKTGDATQHVVFGDIRSNGQVVAEGDPLTEDNALSFLVAHRGKVEANLAGTDGEIPDFTSLGGSDQLFDFGRFRAAAEAGAGTVYENLDDFMAAVEDANSTSSKLEGIIYVVVDPSEEGGSPKLEGDEGINVTGTLVFDFANGTNPFYKIFIKLPLNINAADLSTVTFADESTWTTGYPGVYATPSRQPHLVDITPTYENFTDESDYPALMFNNGVVDIHGAANVCGVVYGPSFIEIENKGGNVQFFNGSVIGGHGIYLQGHGDDDAMLAVRFDPATIDMLETMGNKGMAFGRRGFAILR